MNAQKITEYCLLITLDMKRTLPFTASKYLMLVFLTFISCYAHSQTEKIENKYSAAKFKVFHNGNKIDSIYNLFSPDLQAALPKDKAHEFLGALKAQEGAITAMEFIKYEGPYASYKTKFDKRTFAVNIALDATHKINGFFVKPYEDESLVKPARTLTPLQLPFKDEWTVVWGGDTKELNYHVQDAAQKNAFDLIITDNLGKSFRTNGKTNEDYYAFGKPLYAPCDAEVVAVTDGVADNKPGEMNKLDITGNTVVLKTANNEYLFFAHFKQNSIKVKKGMQVKAGTSLGLCGNSGHSSEPHLHLHVQNTSDLFSGTGIKTFFTELRVNGTTKKDYSPVQKDKIGPLK
jgi:murein DD-endopeptidase MepM/ murein hydrolase activator NlpD